MTADTDDPYRQIAQWYDLEHDPVTDDIECYTALIREHAPPRARVLELGAGSGRAAAALALAGWQVTGIEPSAAMLARASVRLQSLPERVSRRIRLLRGTAAQPGLDLAEQFDVALFGLNVLAHLLTLEERHAALTAVRAHLAPGSLAIIDLDLAAPQRLMQNPGTLWWQGSWPLPGNTHEPAEVSHIVTATRHRDPAILDVTHLYDVSSPATSLRRTIARMSLAVISYGELQASLLHTGYAVEATYGTHELLPFEEESPRAIVVASVREPSP
jgi:SAM-dependent methyltransferase